MDAYDALFEAMKRDTCCFWGQVEIMFVYMDRPQKEWLCDLTDERNPNCAECERYVPRPTRRPK